MYKKGEIFFKKEPETNPDYSEVFRCWRCKEEVKVKLSEPTDRVFCKRCFESHREEHQDIINEYTKLKIKVMYENALRTMEKSKKVYMHEYLDAAQRIYEQAISETERFMSSEEIIVAIVLEEYGFKYSVNYPILGYKVDFYIPELRICVEVDGVLHEHELEYDSKRDIEIRNSLGREWEIIRIPTRYIVQNPTKVVDAIEKLAKEKRKLRKNNQGIMPYGYSKRENKYYDRVFKI